MQSVFSCTGQNTVCMRCRDLSSWSTYEQTHAHTHLGLMPRLFLIIDAPLVGRTSCWWAVHWGRQLHACICKCHSQDGPLDDIKLNRMMLVVATLWITFWQNAYISLRLLVKKKGSRDWSVTQALLNTYERLHDRTSSEVRWGSTHWKSNRVPKAGKLLWHHGSQASSWRGASKAYLRRRAAGDLSSSERDERSNQLWGSLG